MRLAFKSKPLVSVIMNCHNGEKYLTESLHSILNQSYKNWEIIFWDNKSSDKSKKIFKSFKDKRFKYFYSKKKHTLYKSRNLALKKCKGEFIAFLDTDDWWVKDKLKFQVSRFNDPKIGFVYSKYYMYNQITSLKKNIFNNNLPEGKITSNLFYQYNVGIVTTVIRRKILKKYKLKFNPKYQCIGDFDLTIKISQKTLVACVQKPLAFYRVHKNNLSKKIPDTHIKELENWVKANSKIYQNKDIQRFKMIVQFRKIKNFIFTKKIYQAITGVINFPLNRFKIKLILMLILPNRFFNPLI